MTAISNRILKHLKLGLKVFYSTEYGNIEIKKIIEVEGKKYVVGLDRKCNCYLTTPKSKCICSTDDLACYEMVNEDFLYGPFLSNIT